MSAGVHPRPLRRVGLHRGATLAVTLLLAGLGVLLWHLWPAGTRGGVAARTRAVTIEFLGPDGSKDTMVVLMPTWYGTGRNPPLPLLISPHSRGITAEQNATRWGDLPGRMGLIVLNPGLHGRVITGRSWAWPEEVSESVDLPAVARGRLPYLRWDPNRVYAIAQSMGGQEALMMLVHQPDRFAAVAVADPVTDFLDRWYDFPRSRLSGGQQQSATREVGATPEQAPWLYLRRSPLFFARTIAFSGVPVQLWWNPKDFVVIGEGMHQAGALYRAVRRLNPQAPVYAHLHRQVHGYVFSSRHELPTMVRFLLHFRRHGPPAAGFTCESWLPSASVWGWRVRARLVGHRPWRIERVTPRGFDTASAGRLLVHPPNAPRRATIDGRRVVVTAGTVAVPAGIHSVRLLP